MKSYAPVNYHNLSWRIIAAFIAVSYLMLYGQKVSLFHMLHLPMFYVDYGESIVIAFILISWTHLFVRLLDRRFPWEDNLPGRIVMQVIICWIVPCFIAYFLADLYFAVQHIDIEQTNYASRELRVVAIMLGAMNVYYYFHYLFLRLKQRTGINLFDPGTYNKTIKENESFLSAGLLSEEATNDLNNNGDDDTIDIRYNNHSTHIKIGDIACFFKNGKYWIKTLDGNNYPITNSLKNVEEKYTGYNFFRINPKIIINRNAIEGIKKDHLNGTIRINLKNDLILNEDYLVVESKLTAFFEDWLKNGLSHKKE